MKKTLLMASLALCSTWSLAHSPVIVPMDYTPESNHVAVYGSLVEHALVPDLALDDGEIHVISPSYKTSKVNAQKLNTVNFAEVEVNETGTYSLFALMKSERQYVFHDGVWKRFMDYSPAQAEKDRTYLIPSDFKQVPELVPSTSYRSLRTYISKGTPSLIAQFNDQPIHVAFSTHPNELKAQQEVTLNIKNKQQPFSTAQVNITPYGKPTAQGQTFKADEQGNAIVTFPSAGQYMIKIREPFDNSKRPTDEQIVIISVEVK